MISITELMTSLDRITDISKSNNWCRYFDLEISQIRIQFLISLPFSNPPKNMDFKLKFHGAYLSRFPWIFLGAPLKVNGAPANIQGNLTALIVNLTVNLPWIFPGAPLKINGVSGNIQGDSTGMGVVEAGLISFVTYNFIWNPVHRACVTKALRPVQ